MRRIPPELERRWEEALKQQGQLDEEYERWQRSAPGRLTAEDEQAIRSLAADLPALWQAETTTRADRQRIARLLLERVIVTVDKASEKVDVQLHWIGGLVRSHVVSRPVMGYECRSDYLQLVERLRSLSGVPLYAGKIAEQLNAEGFRPPRQGKRYTAGIVLRLLARLGLPRCGRCGMLTPLRPNEFRPRGLARRLGVPRATIRRWLCSGWLNARRDKDGHYIIFADAGELRRLCELRRLIRAGVKGPRVEKLKKPKPQRDW